MGRKARHLPGFTITELLVTIDGQVGTRLVQNEKMSVRRAKRSVRIVRFKGTTFFERLMVKLGWGGLGNDRKADARMIGEVRRAVGPAVEIMLDMGFPIPLEDAI